MAFFVFRQMHEVKGSSQGEMISSLFRLSLTFRRCVFFFEVLPRESKAPLLIFNPIRWSQRERIRPQTLSPYILRETIIHSILIQFIMPDPTIRLIYMAPLFNKYDITLYLRTLTTLPGTFPLSRSPFSRHYRRNLHRSRHDIWLVWDQKAGIYCPF